jgi:hypothetical protein
VDRLDTEQKLAYIRTFDPEAAERLHKLLERREKLTSENIYGERFTERQFSLVVEPLIASGMERSRVLESLLSNDGSVRGLSEQLRIPQDQVFRHIKELLRRNLVHIVRFVDREPLFRSAKKD